MWPSGAMTPLLSVYIILALMWFLFCPGLISAGSACVGEGPQWVWPAAPQVSVTHTRTRTHSHKASPEASHSTGMVPKCSLFEVSCWICSLVCKSVFCIDANSSDIKRVNGREKQMTQEQRRKNGRKEICEVKFCIWASQKAKKHKSRSHN